MSEIKVYAGGLPAGGSPEERTLERFRAAHASGVRRWKDRNDGEEIEVLEIVTASGVPCVRIRYTDGKERGYTMRSSANWDPMPLA